MSKKFFHPSNFDNQKRVWMAQQTKEAEQKKQEELRKQYEREQELFNNKALVSNDEKVRLGINFMYEAPPGLKAADHIDEVREVKFEWQRKFNAPRESYAKGDEAVRDQPFGIEVKNVRCIKCKVWGHVNTDKTCPMFDNAPVVPRGRHKESSKVMQIVEEAIDACDDGSDYDEQPSKDEDKGEIDELGQRHAGVLMRKMREDGLQLKESAVNWSLDAFTTNESLQVQEKRKLQEAAMREILRELPELRGKDKVKLLKKVSKRIPKPTKNSNEKPQSDEETPARQSNYTRGRPVSDSVRHSERGGERYHTNSRQFDHHKHVSGEPRSYKNSNYHTSSRTESGYRQNSHRSHERSPSRSNRKRDSPSPDDSPYTHKSSHSKHHRRSSPYRRRSPDRKERSREHKRR